MEKIAAHSAAKAVKSIAIRADDEGGRFFGVKGAEALVVFTGLFELDVLGDEVGDRDSRADFRKFLVGEQGLHLSTF